MGTLLKSDCSLVEEKQEEEEEEEKEKEKEEEKEEQEGGGVCSRSQRCGGGRTGDKCQGGERGREGRRRLGVTTFRSRCPHNTPVR